MSDQEAIRFTCPHCHKRLRAKPRAAGTEVRCPNSECGRKVSVPEQSEPGQARETKPAAAPASRSPADDVSKLNGEVMGQLMYAMQTQNRQMLADGINNGRAGCPECGREFIVSEGAEPVVANGRRGVKVSCPSCGQHLFTVA